MENGLTEGEMPAPLKSVSASPAFPSGTHRMLFVCLFFFVCLVLFVCFVCLFVSYAIKEKGV